MDKLFAYLRQVFPLEKGLMLRGLAHGVFIVALFFYPVPLLLEKLVKGIPLENLPAFLTVNKAVFACLLIAFLLWIFFSGRNVLIEAGIRGWSAVGLLICSLVLVVLSRGNYVESLIVGVLALAIDLLIPVIKKFMVQYYS